MIEAIYAIATRRDNGERHDSEQNGGGCLGGVVVMIDTCVRSVGGIFKITTIDCLADAGPAVSWFLGVPELELVANNS